MSHCSTSSRPATPRTSGQKPTPTSPASWPTTTPRWRKTCHPERRKSSSDDSGPIDRTDLDSPLSGRRRANPTRPCGGAATAGMTSLSHLDLHPDKGSSRGTRARGSTLESPAQVLQVDEFSDLPGDVFHRVLVSPETGPAAGGLLGDGAGV